MRSQPVRRVLVVVIACGALAAGCAEEAAAETPPVTPALAGEFGPASDRVSDPPEQGVEGVEGEDPTFDDLFPHDPPPPAKAAAQLLVDEAARQLAAMKVTAYQHATVVDEESGTFKYDCSGFLGYALKRAVPDHHAAVKTFASVSRPLAKHYQAFFASIPVGAKKSGWSRVGRTIDLRPGDVVAWLTPPDSTSSNTGHVMIVRAAAYKNPSRADEVIVPIIDSSASYHGATDTRYPTGGGLGAGPIGLIVDSKGAPTRYRWTGGKSTKEPATAISLGRPE